MASETNPGGRADAQRNRARILDVARTELAADPDVSLNVIAKRAAIGPGTLYRHFPSREALLLTVYQDDVATLTASVDQMLAEAEPLDAFRDWSRRLAAQSRIKHGLGEALTTSAAAQELTRANWGPVTAAVSKFLAAAAARGDIRDGVDPVDVIMLLTALWRVPKGEAGLEQADRLLEMIIAALRHAPAR
jgi:AcrR family transcriptional regulator